MTRTRQVTRVAGRTASAAAAAGLHSVVLKWGGAAVANGLRGRVPAERRPACAVDSGRLRGYEVICPLHSARFDIRDGSCKAAPATQPIQSFPVMVEAGKVMVSVEGAKQPPRPRFGPLN